MKRIVLPAAISLAVLASCTKNEPAPSVTEQQEITFASPVVSLNTKALLEGATFPTTQTFNVWAWYSEKEAYDGDGVQYMTDVKVEYSDKNFNDAEDVNGAWAPTPTYYWPKKGRLTFDAYSPTGLAGVSCDKSEGLKITDYEVPQDLTAQVDVLYSDRAPNKIRTSYTSNNPYEGVDLVFNHALAAVAFTVKQSNAYPEGTIKVKDIIIKAQSQGDFAHNISYSGGSVTKSPGWADQKNRVDYKALACDDYANSVQPVNAEGAAGATVLVLPQEFSYTNDVTITVNYFIKNYNEAPLLQKAEFHLKDEANQSGKDTSDNAVQVSKWEMGKKYTYNLTIGLNDIFFAPTITPWEGVTVNLPEIK